MLFEASCGSLGRCGSSWRLELRREIGESSESESGGGEGKSLCQSGVHMREMEMGEKNLLTCSKI